MFSHLSQVFSPAQVPLRSDAQRRASLVTPELSWLFEVISENVCYVALCFPHCLWKHCAVFLLILLIKMLIPQSFFHQYWSAHISIHIVYCLYLNSEYFMTLKRNWRSWQTDSSMAPTSGSSSLAEEVVISVVFYHAVSFSFSSPVGAFAVTSLTSSSKWLAT